jgi:hypothetical protein
VIVCSIFLVITLDMIVIKFSKAPYLSFDPPNNGNRYDRSVGMRLGRLNNALIVQPFDRLGEVQHRHLPTCTGYHDHAIEN